MGTRKKGVAVALRKDDKGLSGSRDGGEAKKNQNEKVSEGALRDLCGEQAAGKLPLLPGWVLGRVVRPLTEMKVTQGFPDKKPQALPGRSAH